MKKPLYNWVWYFLSFWDKMRIQTCIHLEEYICSGFANNHSYRYGEKSSLNLEKYIREQVSVRSASLRCISTTDIGSSYDTILRNWDLRLKSQINRPFVNIRKATETSLVLFCFLTYMRVLIFVEFDAGDLMFLAFIKSG